MAFSREIIKKILQNVRFRVPKNERDSYYTTINNTLVRVSNHCTRLYVWDNFLEENPKCKGMPIVSIVFSLRSRWAQSTMFFRSLTWVRLEFS